MPGNPARQREVSAVDEWFRRYNASHPASSYGPSLPQPVYTFGKVEKRMSAHDYNDRFLPLWASLYSARMAAEGLLASPWPSDLDKQKEISIRAGATRDAKELLYGKAKR